MNYNSVIADMTIRGVNLVKLNLIFERRKKCLKQKKTSQKTM